MLNRGSGSICEAHPCSPSGFKMLLQTEGLLSYVSRLHLMTTLRLLFGITEKQEHTKRLF